VIATGDGGIGLRNGLRAIGDVTRLGGTDEDEDDSIRAAVAAATREKFIFSIWDGAFVIANRYSIDSLHLIEWDKGPCGSRLGTLNLSFPGLKQV
jgi:hypothetical protein